LQEISTVCKKIEDVNEIDLDDEGTTQVIKIVFSFPSMSIFLNSVYTR
jgi:hypothetical protein